MAGSAVRAPAEVTILAMKVRDIIKLLERDGWFPPGTLNSVIKQAGLKP
jgi:predicted RNA binding protein YcfA (HicA-like mRNA interferase family)